MHSDMDARDHVYPRTGIVILSRVTSQQGLHQENPHSFTFCALHKKAMSSTFFSAFQVSQKSRWPFKSKKGMVAQKSTCILTKVQPKNVIHHCLSLLVVIHCCPMSSMLSAVVHHRPLSSAVVCHHPLSSTVIHHCLSSVIVHCRPLLVLVVVHCHLLLVSVVIVHHRLSPRASSVVIFAMCHWWW